MNTWPITCLLAAALATTTGASALDNTNAADAATAPTLREVEPFVARIPVRNPYDRAVKVKLLDPTCSCATLEMAEKFILPKSTTTLNIAVLNTNRSGPMTVGVSVFLTDPDLETIEVVARWNIRACVQVDAIGPTMDPLKRPDDPAWRDVYRYVSKVRPDELGRLRKRIRVSTPTEETPAGGLKIEGIDYQGTLWKFTPTAQADGSILITATARDPETEFRVGDYNEAAIVRTNHPDKAQIELRFQTAVDRDAGARSVDPQSGLLPPPGLPLPPQGGAGPKP